MANVKDELSCAIWCLNRIGETDGCPSHRFDNVTKTCVCGYANCLTHSGETAEFTTQFTAKGCSVKLKSK